MNIHPQLKNPKFYLVVLSDALLFSLALFFAYWFRFEFSLDAFRRTQLADLLLWIVPLKLTFFFFSGLYRGMWRYTSTHDFWLLARMSLLATLVIISVILYFNRFENYSRAVFAIDGFLTFVFTGGLRMAIRAYYAWSEGTKTAGEFMGRDKPRRIIIVGAGDAGEKLLREISEKFYLQYRVSGFVDDDPAKKGRTIHGVKIFGSVNDLPRIAVKKHIQEIFIVIPSATGEQMRKIVETCRDIRLPYKVLPGIGDIIDGKVSVKLLRDINYEDLLRRNPVHLSLEGISRYIAGKTIFITGGGGSIGSELCRQVIKFNPARLLILDSSELNLFQIEMEMNRTDVRDRFETILGKVQDEHLVRDIFGRFKPQIVFHAAACKHVPMQERNPWEAVYTNIVGSQVVTDAAVAHGAECFVLVSTDKAVRPVSVMGATKRIAEMILQSRQGDGTRMMAVRFGNVIGSSGSVIPTFLHQIEKGGPVTVTHPDVSRFFMTVSEATQLILQAAAMGSGGEIFVLKMGVPIKIAEMARDLIRLAGKKPDEDVPIVYTGLREGEKLHEEWMTENEDVAPTRHEKIMVLRSEAWGGRFESADQLRKALEETIPDLMTYARAHDAQAIKQKLKDLVADYQPQETHTVLQ
ncbi:MAG TPA: nucleoside-diphosphate sugar epimerase/dehydratase [Smithella sp.]|nr:nucleoside-diphosphate sugar epimerase/dehydratase [Smithella sp.]